MGVRCRTRFDGNKIKRKVHNGSFKSLNHAAAAIRLTARRSIKRNPRKSTEGTPPNTRRGLLKRALLYKVDKARLMSVIGPAHSIAGRSGSAHEFGRKYYGRNYPRRAFMGPAMEVNRSRISRLWAGSVK